jgi:hypothetical protein
MKITKVKYYENKKYENKKYENKKYGLSRKYFYLQKIKN